MAKLLEAVQVTNPNPARTLRRLEYIGVQSAKAIDLLELSPLNSAEAVVWSGWSRLRWRMEELKRVYARQNQKTVLAPGYPTRGNLSHLVYEARLKQKED